MSTPHQRGACYDVISAARRTMRRCRCRLTVTSTAGADFLAGNCLRRSSPLGREEILRESRLRLRAGKREWEGGVFGFSFLTSSNKFRWSSHSFARKCCPFRYTRQTRDGVISVISRTRAKTITALNPSLLARRGSKAHTTVLPLLVLPSSAESRATASFTAPLTAVSWRTSKESLSL